MDITATLRKAAEQRQLSVYQIAKETGLNQSGLNQFFNGTKDDLRLSTARSCVIIWVCRFDSIEAGHWIHPLRQNGVHLVAVAQGKIDWSDFAGRMLYGTQQEGKHAYLRDLSKIGGPVPVSARTPDTENAGW